LGRPSALFAQAGFAIQALDKFGNRISSDAYGEAGKISNAFTVVLHPTKPPPTLDALVDESAWCAKREPNSHAPAPPRAQPAERSHLAGASSSGLCRKPPPRAAPRTARHVTRAALRACVASPPRAHA
jgi:hypothetical protein